MNNRKKEGASGESRLATVVVETPKGSRNKFKYDPGTRMFKLSKVLPEGMVFPYDFGFVTSTKGEDGDPIDVLVLLEEATFPGCLLECRIVGVIEAEQEDNLERKRNDRVIAVAQQSLLFSDITHIRDLRPATLKQITAFFVNYQKLRNVEFTVLACHGPSKALDLLARGGLKTNQSRKGGGGSNSRERTRRESGVIS